MTHKNELKDISSYEFYFFDCDGVILDSNDIKSQVFEQILKRNFKQDHVEAFLSYHKGKGGVSRYIKFKYFFEHIVHQRNYEKKLEFLLQEFSVISRQKLHQAKLIPFLIDFLNILKEKKKKMIVISGSDQDDLIEILNFHGLADFFYAIFGSPRTKKQILNEFKKHNNLKEINGVFFGDSLLDFQTSVEFNFDFYFVSHNSEFLEYEEYKFNVINNFKDLIS